MTTRKQGFASMDEQKRKEAAQKGGQSQESNTDSTNLADDTQKASEV